VHAVSLSEDGYYLITGGRDRAIRLWITGKGLLLAKYTAHQKPIYDLNFCPFIQSFQGLYFVSASGDKYSKLWHTETANALRVFCGHENEVLKAVFHTNIHYVFTASSDKSIRLWDMSNGL
jgi:WD40 repeat protein